MSLNTPPARPEWEIPRLMMRRLAETLGVFVRFDSNTNNFTCLNGTITQDDVTNAYNDVLVELRKKAIRDEADRRILACVRDQSVKINILLWYVRASSEERRPIGKLLDWMIQTRMTANILTDVEDYQDDKHWPAPPADANKTVERFL